MHRAPTAAAPARPRSRTTAIGGTALALGLLLSGCSAAEEEAPPTPSASDTYLNGVLSSPSQSAPDPLAVDIDFVTKTLRNHRDAVRQSERFLEMPSAQGEIRRIAERIRDQQGARAQELTAKLEGWGAAVPTEEPIPSAAPATASSTLSVEEEMAAEVERSTTDLRSNRLTEGDWTALENAEDDLAPGVYLLQMHRLHQGAVTLASNELRSGTDEATKKLAQEISDGSQKDMVRMVQLLRERGLIGAEAPRTGSWSGYHGPIKMTGVGAEGGTVDFTPTAVLSARASMASREAASPSRTPSPADTARPTPSPGSGASPSPSSTPRR